ncbi:hypothetical protein FUT69_02725 [Xylella taiwanensis]|uniref:Uncharacterized protein n=1 Tax=Xylella taiwanensis TaxID=1444770 RepID=Z9JIH7_9GAMM|nr:hypothetical protein [Xylella taiwanensis]AXI83964.1 hypothetical protein AB672_08465 [Xylella taiwanensis]EWS77823.1 hypothetical protein AF72_08580 [Xylella taiwanensis]MCD8457070.1 hypothetical protein [Xylella taiwanensis]MCD8459480.1 hypothetical protein [Xylella taiwanensis]MCD8461651.1 hypothetical protein [Xylella taiwanensis]
MLQQRFGTAHRSQQPPHLFPYVLPDTQIIVSNPHTQAMSTWAKACLPIARHQKHILPPGSVNIRTRHRYIIHLPTRLD